MTAWLSVAEDEWQSRGDNEVELHDRESGHAGHGIDEADRRGRGIQGLGDEDSPAECRESGTRGAVLSDEGVPAVTGDPFQAYREQQDIQPVGADRQSELRKAGEQRR